MAVWRPKLTQLATESIGIHHVGLWRKDLQRRFTFYTEGLGYTVNFKWSDSEPSFGAAATMLKAPDDRYLELFS